MRYFVTGATGFIGGNLVRELIRRGHQVSAVVRTPAKADDLKALGVEIYQGDITERASLVEPMRGADGVFHVAAWYKIGAKDGHMAADINVGGTRNVLEVMRDLGIPKGVYTSTLAVYSNTNGRAVDESYVFTGTHLSNYDRTKADAHYQVALPMMQAGLPLVIVQPGLVYGKDDPSAVGKSVHSYLRRQLPVLPQQSAHAWAHVDDVVEGHILAMERGKVGEAYNICGEIMRLTDAFKLAEHITGIPAPMLTAPPVLFKLMSVLAKPFDAFLPEAYTSEGLRIVAGVTYIGSNAKAKRELGYKPRPVATILRDVLPYEMQKLGIKS